MSLTGTSSPIGTLIQGEEIYLDSAPDVYICDTQGSYRFNPDTDGFYWGLSGTASHPVYKLGCFSDFVFGDDVTMNDIMCDTDGLRGVIQKRSGLHASFRLLTLMPLTQLAQLLRIGTVTSNASDGAEKVGVGDTTRKTNYWRVYFNKIYDDEGDFLSVTMHRCQFVDAWEIAMPYGDKWSIPLSLRAFADTSKPTAQRYATIVRVDPSVVV